jgi:hypothetical protein
MKIGLDFDGVIADCGRLKSDQAKKLYGIDIPPAECKKETIISRRHLTAEQYRAIQDTICTQEIGLSMDPVDGMLHYLPQLITNGHSISIVTSRGKTATRIAEEWSARQGLRLSFVSVDGGNKADAVKGLDLYVDDDLYKLELLVDVVPNLFLFTWGYNIRSNPRKGIRRANSWGELFYAIQSIGGAG